MVLETGRRAMRYIVNEITGPYAIAPDNGQKLYDQIHPVLLSGQNVELDLDGTKVFASAFFNFAVGQLLKDLSPDALNQQLHITGLNDNGQNILRRVIDNAKRYYDDPRYQQAVDSVMEEYAASC
jgi:STAS-like domain of unknown function (DUF4325)